MLPALEKENAYVCETAVFVLEKLAVLLTRLCGPAHQKLTVPLCIVLLLPAYLLAGWLHPVQASGVVVEGAMQ